MIFIGIGSNLAAPGFGSPQETAAAGLAALPGIGIALSASSRWYLSEPVPPSDQPWYANAVASIATRLGPEALLEALLVVEQWFGRRRTVSNAARTLDLDLLDYCGRECASPRLVLPHPRLHERRFVLMPLAEIAPRWRHPRSGRSAAELLTGLPPGQAVRPAGEPRV